MANRPRRPRTSKQQADTASGDRPAERDLEENAIFPDAAAEPDPDRRREDTQAAEPDLASDGLPPPQNQPSLTAADISGETFASSPAVGDADGDDRGLAASDGGGEIPSERTVDEFAAQEGLAVSPERPKRDLGEFEDDETVLTAAEPETVATPPLTHPSSDFHTLNGREGAGAGIGSLFLAALLGGGLALAAAWLLMWNGILSPGEPQTAGADQYALAGEVERVAGDVGSLRESVEQLQSAQAAGGASVEGAAASDVAALSDRIAAAEGTIQEMQGAGTAEAAGAAEETARSAVETAEAARAAAEEAGANAQEAQSALADFETRIAAVETASRQAALALAAASLKAAIDAGEPFMPQLEAFATAGGDEGSVAALRDYAAEGVPSEADLRAEWPEVETGLRQTLASPGPDATMGDQLVSGLRGLVTVRPTGEAVEAADDPEARLARMAAALNSGDLQAWQTEWDALPDSAKTAGETFAGRVEARLAAGNVLDDALQGAVSATSETHG